MITCLFYCFAAIITTHELVFQVYFVVEDCGLFAARTYFVVLNFLMDFLVIVVTVDSLMNTSTAKKILNSLQKFEFTFAEHRFLKYLSLASLLLLVYFVKNLYQSVEGILMFTGAPFEIWYVITEIHFITREFIVLLQTYSFCFFCCVLYMKFKDTVIALNSDVLTADFSGSKDKPHGR